MIRFLGSILLVSLFSSACGWTSSSTRQVCYGGDADSGESGAVTEVNESCAMSALAARDATTGEPPDFFLALCAAAVIRYRECKNKNGRTPPF